MPFYLDSTISDILSNPLGTMSIYSRGIRIFLEELLSDENA